MKFKILNRVLLPADDFSAEWLATVVDHGLDVVELHSNLNQRSVDQNAKLWAMLKDFSDQIEWAGDKRSPTEWKHLLSAAFEQALVLPGLDHVSVVTIPAETRRFTKKKFRDFIESVYATGEEMGVKWSEPALEVYDEIVKTQSIM